MIELRITGETPQAFLEQLVIAHAAMTFRGAVVNMARPSAAPSVGSVDNENPTETVEVETTTTETVAKPARRGRKPAGAPEPEATEVAPETGPVVAEIAAVAEEIDVPKDLEGMRALLGSLIPKFGVEAVNAIVHPIAPVLSKVPVEKYPEIARLAHKKLAEDAA